MRTVNGLFSSRSKGFHRLAHNVLKKMNAEEKFGGMFLHFDNHSECDDLNPVLEERLTAALPQTAERIVYYLNNLDKIALGEIDNVFDKDYTGEKIV